MSTLDIITKVLFFIITIGEGLGMGMIWMVLLEIKYPHVSAPWYIWLCTAFTMAAIYNKIKTKE